MNGSRGISAPGIFMFKKRKGGTESGYKKSIQNNST